MTTSVDSADLQTVLASAHDILTQVETVLAHSSQTTRHEITAILAEHAGNHGGWGWLIDLVQFTAADVNHHINH